MDKLNRAERRKNKFGGGRAAAQGGWPTVQPNPVFSGDTPADEAPDGGAAPDGAAPKGPKGAAPEEAPASPATTKKATTKS